MQQTIKLNCQAICIAVVSVKLCKKVVMVEVAHLAV